VAEKWAANIMRGRNDFAFHDSLADSHAVLAIFKSYE